MVTSTSILNVTRFELLPFWSDELRLPVQFPSGPCLHKPYSGRSLGLSVILRKSTHALPSSTSWLALHVWRPLILVSWTHTATGPLCLAQWALRPLSCCSTVPLGLPLGTHREMGEMPFFPLFMDLDDLDPEVTLLVPRILQTFMSLPLGASAHNLFSHQGSKCVHREGPGDKRQPVCHIILIAISIFPRSPCTEKLKHNPNQQDKYQKYFFSCLHQNTWQKQQS